MGNATDSGMDKNTATKVLEKFNQWRRGEGEYSWREDPSKNKMLEYSPEIIGEAIDFAVDFLKRN